MAGNQFRADSSNLLHAMTLEAYKKLDLKRPYTDRPMSARSFKPASPDTPAKGPDTRTGSLRNGARNPVRKA